MAAKKRRPAGQTIGGILAGFDQQVWRTTPPANELVAKGTPLRPVAAAGGGTIRVGMPGDPPAPDGEALEVDRLRLCAPGVEVEVDPGAGGRMASFRVDGRELLVTEGIGPMATGSFPMAPYAGRIRNARFEFRGRSYALPDTMAPHAIHGTVYYRPWQRVDDRTIEIDLGPEWPFGGHAVQHFELDSRRLICRLEVHADVPMPASLGWHPWFRRRLERVQGSADAGPLELEFEAGAMYRRDTDGIATAELVAPPPRPWDDCFIDLRRPPLLRWPGLLELTIESDCPAWVIFTEPDHALCVEPQTAPPDALNGAPAVVEPGRPLVAEMAWTWRSLAG
jgi:aldose 1-epimerase